jgi:tripartite-type tricarboxylate transporter receptor subunit TctC
MIGNDAVAKAKPDGYTLLMNGAAFTIAPAVYRKLPYDALRDFAPITNAVVSPNVMAVHPSVPARTMKELITLAKARPDQILYSSGGTGTNSHIRIDAAREILRKSPERKACGRRSSISSRKRLGRDTDTRSSGRRTR